MVEPPDLRRPTREQALRRRLLATLVLGAGIAAAAWAVTSALKTNDGTAPATAAVPPKVIQVLFPEGFTRREMAARIASKSPAVTAQAYLGATASSPLPGELAGDGTPRDLEGFLFPATYELFDNDPADRLVEKQLAAFRRTWRKVNLRYARSKNLTPYDVLIIASMIEKEAVVDRERKLIAAVIYNRLRARMPLGIDATTRYALDVPGTKSLTGAQLRDPSPYNTRIHRGLPPTPIANPGLKSMQAGAHPASVDYLYFVAKPDKKHHYFTASFDDFTSYKAEHGYER